MQRVLCFMLAVVMLLSLAACGEGNTASSSDEASDGTVTASGSQEPTDEPAAGSHEVISLDFIKTFDQKPAIEEQSVYDKNDLTVKASSLKYDTVIGPQIMLNIHNGTEDQLVIQNNFTVVNGFMITPDVNISVPAGKTVNAPMSLPYLGLAMADIHSLATVEFSLRILSDLTYALFDVTDTVKLVLTDTAKETPAYNDEGQVAYDDHDVKIVLKGVKQDTLFDNRFVVLVYMENNSDKPVSVLNSELTVNGYDITKAMLTELLPGTRAVDKIELFDNELDENGITAIDTVDVAFRINDDEEWGLIAETDVVALELEKPVPIDAAAEEAVQESN